jgi:DNA-binding transcriptional ArsR family regulator
MQISEPTAIRALAHPVRLDLLDLLVALGPATAAQCGRVLGVSQASCSFHLRQLAKYGLVQDAGPGQDRRERRWQAADRKLTITVTGAGDGLARRELERLIVEREMQAILAYAERDDGEFPDWRHKAGVVSAVAVLSPDEAAELKDQWKALLEPYVARAAGSKLRLQPGQRYVRCFMAASPQPEITTGVGEHAEQDE